MTIPLCLFLLLQAGAVDLPAPEMRGGKPLMEAFSARRSAREFAPKEIPLAQLARLLWAAYGINRAAEGGRTAPSAHNWQTIRIYVVLKTGIYLYQSASNRLELVAAGEHRAVAGTQEFVETAPLNLVYAADLEKTRKAEGDTDMDIAEWVAIEAGAISQNVSLFCASEGLATVVRVGVQREQFARLARLGPRVRIVAAQTVGYPALK